MEINLSELLLEAQVLANDTRMQQDGPLIERTLPEVLQEAAKLHERVKKEEADQTGDQAKLLGDKQEVDVENLSQKVDNLNIGALVKATELLLATDVRGNVKKVVQDSIISIINESRKDIYNIVKSFSSHLSSEEWNKEHIQLLLELNELKSEKTVPIEPADRTPCGLNSHQLVYAQEIIKYNRSQDSITFMEQFTQKADEQFAGQDVEEMWYVLDFMAQEAPLFDDIKNVIPARQHDEKFKQQARLYLEQVYRENMYDIIKQNGLPADWSGRPNVYNKVKLFAHINFRQRSKLDGLHDLNAEHVPLWPHVYYSLRSGDLSAAAQFLMDWESPCPDLLQLILQKQQRMYPQVDTEPNSPNIDRLDMEFNRLRDCSDPYKKGVFAILLGFCPIDDPLEIVYSVEDFIWVQLASEESMCNLTVETLQSLLKTWFGERYSVNYKAIVTYFKILVLTGRFELAVEYVSRIAAYHLHAVHMAIAINDISLLGTVKGEKDSMFGLDSIDEIRYDRLYLVRLIVSYAKKIEKICPYEALHYYYVLREQKTSDGRNLMLECITDLLVKKPSQDLIKIVFGTCDLSESWRYSGGIFSDLPEMDCYKCELAQMVGDELMRRRSYESAIGMYIIAEDLEKALELMCYFIPNVMNQTMFRSSGINAFRTYENHIKVALDSGLFNLSAHVVDNYNILLAIVNFFDCCCSYESKLESVDMLVGKQIIPNTFEELNGCLTKLKTLHVEFFLAMPHILLSFMHITCKEHSLLKSGNSSGKATMEQLEDRAKAIVIYADIIPNPTPLYIYAELIELEKKMHIL